VSRVVDRRFIFGDAEREQFVHWMQAYAQFCGVRVLAYCVMSNHFHLLIEVCRRPEGTPNDEELLRRLGLVKGERAEQALRQQWTAWPEVQKQQWRAQATDQMWDVSAYLKLLKQRFTQWHNRRAGRKGTLWEERFKSALVQGERGSLAAVAAYIDLNPVRAGLVEDPKDFRWCGYAAAVAGRRAEREGIAAILNAGQSREVTRTEALEQYRMWVFGEGQVEGVSAPGQGAALRPGISPERVREVLAKRGKLSWAEYARCRVRYFADGAVIGSRDWVNGVFASRRERFGPKRQEGARRFRFLAGTELFSVRDLRIDPVTVSGSGFGVAG
jgi:REP element-mobilizing transposase RayT